EEVPALLKSFDIRNQHVTTYLPRKLVNMRFLEIPSTDPAEVADIVRLQGIKQTPYSREEVILSHTLLGSRREGYSDVVLAFCQRKFVDERIGLLALAGLKADRIGVSSEGVVDWYVTNQTAGGLGTPQGLVFLIDCDSSFSDVLFCQDGRFLFSRNIAAGSSHLSQDSDEKIEEFCGEILQAIDLTAEEFRMPEPRKAVLIASIPPNPRLRETVEKKLGLSVEFIDPAASLPGKTIAPLFGINQYNPASRRIMLMTQSGRRRQFLIVDTAPGQNTRNNPANTLPRNSAGP
ncbi:MAG: pilus assembly protein PilM, partial [Elusimicrobia bacterium]|nr:pilus assembly protein PilM [Elusimicrobiota bacterium]